VAHSLIFAISVVTILLRKENVFVFLGQGHRGQQSTTQSSFSMQ